MNKLNFFYNRDAVYQESLRALERRKFKIVESDPTNGLIKARSKSGILKPSVQLEIQIHQVSEKQTSLDLRSKISKSWLTPGRVENLAEEKFIRTLYRCMEKQ